MGTIEHIDEYEQAVREIHRVLRPGGRAIVGVPHQWDPFLRPLLVKLLDLFGRYPYSPEKAFGGAELCDLVTRSGLGVRSRTGILALPGILRMAELFLHKARLALLSSHAGVPPVVRGGRAPLGVGPPPGLPDRRGGRQARPLMRGDGLGRRPQLGRWKIYSISQRTSSRPAVCE